VLLIHIIHSVLDLIEDEMKQLNDLLLNHNEDSINFLFTKNSFKNQIRYQIFTIYR
jgi:hypothetical protein